MTDPARDRARDPHGPLQLPDDSPPRNATDLSNQEALRTGATSRWLVPAAVLAGVSIVLFVAAFQLQLILPIVGIVAVTVAWVVMLVVARRGGATPHTNRVLAWLMGSMALVALLVALGIYLVESTQAP